MSIFDGLFSGTNISDDARGTTATALQALGAGLLSGDRYQPIGPGFSQTLALAQKGSPKAALKQILLQAGYSEADAEKLSANEAVAKLAIDQKREAGLDADIKAAFPTVPTGQASITPPAPSGAAAGVRLNGDAATSFLNTLIGKESGGNATAKNPNSSATGLTQFTSGTWDQMMRQHPELGLTPDGRTDPEQAKRAALAYARDNAAELGKSGHEATPGNLYLGHFLGGGGATRFLNGLRNNPNAPAASYADPSAVAANRSVFFNRDGTPKSAQDFYNERTSRFGGGAPVQTADAGAAAQRQPTATDAPSPGLPRLAGQPAPAELGVESNILNSPMRQQMAGDNPADVPNTGAQPAGFNIPPAPGSQPTQVPANTTQNAARIRLQNEVNQTLALIARSGSRGERGKALAEALKLKIAPLQKYLEPTDIERTLAAADAASPEAAAIIRNSITDARPTSVREFEYARGTPGFEEYQKRMAESARSQVNIDQRAAGKFEEGLGSAAADRFNELIKTGDAANGRLSDLNTLRETSRALGSLGKSAEARAALGPYLESIGIKVDGLSDIQLFNSTVDRLAPQLRAPGSGVTSDRDLAGFTNSIGRLSNSPEAREKILDVFEAAARNQKEAARIARQVSAGKMTREVGEDALQNLPDPMTAFREYRKNNPDPGAPQQQGQRQAPVQMNTTDRAMSLRNARDALKRNPGARDAILQRLRDAGLPSDGL